MSLSAPAAISSTLTSLSALGIWKDIASGVRGQIGRLAALQGSPAA